MRRRFGGRRGFGLIVGLMGGLIGALVWSGASAALASDRQIPMAEYVQQIWDARDGGLPHPTVTAFAQTRDGYLWIGTYAGLVRFDGLLFHRPIVDAHPVYRDHVRGLIEAADGSLWVATRRNGVVRIQDGTVRRAFTAKDGLAGTDVVSVAATRDGRVWVVAGEGLASIERNGSVRRYGAGDGLTVERAMVVFAENDGTLWIGGRRGEIAWYDGREFHAVSEWTKVHDSTTDLRAIVRDAGGALWIGTASALFQLAGERTGATTARRRFDGAIASLSVDERGLWAGTNANGIVRFEGEVEKRYGPAEGLLHEWALALYEDAQQNLWVGTRTGLVQLRPRIIQNYTRREGLPSVHATCVLATRDGDLWVGTSAGLARRHDERWTTFGVKEGLPQGTVRALAEGPDGSVHVGTADGIARYRGGRLTTVVGTGRGYNVRGLAVDSKGRLWVALSRGVERLENGEPTTVVTHDRMYKGAAANVILPAADGSVWIGGDSVLMHFHEGAIEPFFDSDVLPRNDVRYLGQDPDGTVWVGSIGGLSRVKHRKLEALAGPKAPFNTGNYAVLDDGRGALWISTTKGLFRVLKEDIDRHGGLAAALAFGSPDGLEAVVLTGSGQPSGSRGPDGRLYFTSLNGIAVVDPVTAGAKVLAVSPPPNVVGIVADGRAVERTGTPQLAAGTREVEIQFAAVNFVSPELVRYRYRLEGLDTDWRASTSGRVANYTNLRPGRYVFRVESTDHTGVWHEPGASLAFDLRPRFHQTLWFRSFALLALAAAIFGLHRLRLAAARAHAAEMERRVAEAMASLRVLQGLVPICSRCRRVHQDAGAWQQLEVYVMERSKATFSHSICAECYARLKAEDPDLPEMTIL